MTTGLQVSDDHWTTSQPFGTPLSLFMDYTVFEAHLHNVCVYSTTILHSLPLGLEIGAKCCRRGVISSPTRCIASLLRLPFA